VTVEMVNDPTATHGRPPRGPLGATRDLFRAFRRTRPFWGGVWMILGGLDIVYWVRNPIGIVLGGGWSTSAGYIVGGSMIVFALVGWFSPHYKGVIGVVGMLLALVAFIAANLGGFLIGSVLGVIGGAMVWGWGPKKAKDQPDEAVAT